MPELPEVSRHNQDVDSAFSRAATNSCEILVYCPVHFGNKVSLRHSIATLSKLGSTDSVVNHKGIQRGSKPVEQGEDPLRERNLPWKQVAPV
jgi:hypothetical protein